MKAFRLAAKKGKARKAGATQGQEVESRAGCRRYQEHEAESWRDGDATQGHEAESRQDAGATKGNKWKAETGHTTIEVDWVSLTILPSKRWTVRSA